MPEVSIIVPVYNVESYIHRCVDSILTQTFSDFELILVDDGSPDNCPAICDQYAKKDSRIRVIHKQNGGLASARNAGLDIAIGNYILFCDSDDYVNPEWCSSLLKLVTKHHKNYIAGGYAYYFPKSHQYDIRSVDQISSDSVFKIYDFIHLQINDLIGYAWNVLYYSDVIKRLHLRFRTDVIIEDLPFCLEYLSEMDTISLYNTPLYLYSQHESNSLSRKYYQNSFEKWKEKYVITQNFIDTKVPQNKQASIHKSTADYYLYFFLHALSDTFDSRNTWSLFQKISYNNKVVHSPEFQHCLAHADGSNENPTYLSLLKKGNYLPAFIYTCAAKLKSRLLKNKH